MPKDNEVSRSKALASKLIFAALSALRDNGRELPRSQVLVEVEKRVSLDEWAMASYEKTGNIRWRSMLHFYTIDCIKAGFLVKKKGVWYLTQEGEDALKLGEVSLLEAAQKAYRKWRADAQSNSIALDSTEELVVAEEQTEEITFEDAQQQALDGIKHHINSMNPYEFQELVAALLRGMGYYTPFVAPRGKDGGVDVIAYRDPLGTVSPRIKIQIKHRESSANVQEIRQLMGLMQKDGDVGIFVSTGGFTPEAKITARGAQIHVELIDLDRFINLWIEFQQNLSDEDKARLPLQPIYFIKPRD